MEILPEEINPFPQQITRRHKPKRTRRKDGYQSFRQCLRWEFGFTCALCLLHESDLAPRGAESAEGFRLTTVEHLTTRHARPELANAYRNCIYACQMCNGARSTKPRTWHGARLLNPVTSVWSEHFAAAKGYLVPRPGDADAAYTESAYDLNDPIKVGIRLARARHLAYLLKVVRRGPAQLRTLEVEIARTSGTVGNVLREYAAKLKEDIAVALEEIQRYAAIPRDRKTQAGCKCLHAGTHTLPSALAQQVVDVDLRAATS